MAKVKAWKLEKQKNKPLVSSKVFHVAEIVEHAIALGLLHAGVDVEARVT